MDTLRVPAGGPWAEVVGYSRAVRVGNVVHVAGTAAVAPDGTVAHPGDPYRQALRCLELITDALRRVGAAPEQVVRTRLFVKRRADWQEVGRAHGEYFGEARPVTSMIFAELIDPEMLVEIEAEALVRFPPHFSDVPTVSTDTRGGG